MKQDPHTVKIARHPLNKMYPELHQPFKQGVGNQSETTLVRSEDTTGSVPGQCATQLNPARRNTKSPVCLRGISHCNPADTQIALTLKGHPAPSCYGHTRATDDTRRPRQIPRHTCSHPLCMATPPTRTTRLQSRPPPPIPPQRRRALDCRPSPGSRSRLGTSR